MSIYISYITVFFAIIHEVQADIKSSDRQCSTQLFLGNNTFNLFEPAVINNTRTYDEIIGNCGLYRNINAAAKLRKVSCSHSGSLDYYWRIYDTNENVIYASKKQLEYSFDLESYMAKFHNACADNYIYEFRCGCYLQSDCNCGPFQFPQSKVPNGTPIRLSSTPFQKQQCQNILVDDYWLRRNTAVGNFESQFENVRTYFPAQPNRTEPVICPECKVIQLQVNNKDIYLEKNEHSWSCSIKGDTHKYIFSNTCCNTPNCNAFIDKTDQWCLRDGQLQNPVISLISREIKTTCPSNIRNMFLPCTTHNGEQECHGGMFNKISSFRDDHTNVPKCHPEFNCPTHITIDNHTYNDDGGVFTSESTNITVSRQCSNWMVSDTAAVNVSFVGFAEEQDQSLCLYNLARISKMDKLCASTLYLGFLKFEYHSVLKKYYAYSSDGLKYLMEPTQHGWKINVLLSHGEEVYAVASFGHDDSDMTCPNNLNWFFYCKCYTIPTCECGSLEYTTINAPKIHPTDNCPTCIHPMTRGVNIQMTKTLLPQTYERPLIGRNLTIGPDETGKFRVESKSNNETELIFSAIASDSSCPQDVKIWLNEISNLHMLNGSSTGQYQRFPVSSQCFVNDWQTQNNRFQYTEEVSDCDFITAFFGDKLFTMSKVQAVNEWAVTHHKVNYRMKLVEDKNDNGNGTDTYSWGIINSDKSQNGADYLVAKSDDFSVQFPYQVKNWYLLCDDNNDCFEGHLIKDVFQYKESHDKLPTCTKSMPEDENGSISTIAIVSIVTVVLVLNFVLFVYIQNWYTNGKPYFKRGKQRYDDSENRTHYTTAVNQIPSITNEVRLKLEKQYIPQNEIFGTNREKLGDKCGQGFFSQVYTGQIKWFTNLGEKELRNVAIKCSIKAKCCKNGSTECSAMFDDLKEASFLAACEHEYIVCLLGATMEDQKHVALIMPLYQQNLQNFITNKNNDMSILQALKFMYKTALGLEFLIQKNVLHHDISTRNILLDDNLEPKISDFGLASKTDSEFDTYFKITGTPCLPIKNFSPERFDHRCSAASEVYSFAFTIYEILTRGKPSHPFDNIIDVTDYATTKLYVQDRSHSPANVDCLPTVLREKAELTPIRKFIRLYQAALAYHTKDRPTFSYLATELRNLHNFIGRNRMDITQLNFPLVQRSSPYVYIPDTESFSPQVNSLYRIWENSRRSSTSTESTDLAIVMKEGSVSSTEGSVSSTSTSSSINPTYHRCMPVSPVSPSPTTTSYVNL